MAEAFKNAFNEQVIRLLADIFQRVYPAFSKQSFIDGCLDGLESLELKERVALIIDNIDRELPDDFDEFGTVLLAAMHPDEDGDELTPTEFGPEGAKGFPAWPLIDAVVRRGLDEPAKALSLLKELTKRFSAEFAIRPFIDKYPEYAFDVLSIWVADKNRHVRRLASEGARPRLPWGMQLKALVVDPSPLLPILEALKDDKEEYVRRSVANNLNDIAKDHPDLVAEIAERWLVGADKNRKRLVRHACRTLIKQGHEGVLRAFGYSAPEGLKANIEVRTPNVLYGAALEFTVNLSSGIPEQSIMVDYAVHFMKANGTTAPKVFKWKDTMLSKEGEISATRKHAIKPITTRTYYAGEHKLEIFVNGVSVGVESFTLTL